ncbi:MAG TPA: hypothetical protein VEB39_05210 [Sphingomicrobium sp.]|nr:hypothetical protein [Sphingomicrobium sp.]
MSFLGKIFGRAGGAVDQVADQPVRTRSFSATQFREEELARAAEARARAAEVQIDAAQVLSPAINPVAEALMAEEPETVEAPEPVPVAAPPPAVDPMPWDEAVGWLSQRSAETQNFVGTYWNWDYDLRVLHFLAQQPDLDAGVAAHIFWITAACEDYFPFGDDEPDSEISQQIAWLTDFLGRRFAEDAFRPASHGFDDSWDCVRLKRRLVDLHAKDCLPWSPDAIPTSSTAELMSFDDIPEEEREEVAAFLARFGVY